MTWNEFKEFIDEQILTKNLDPDMEIWYIDISYPDFSHEMSIPEIEECKEGLAVS